MGTIWHEEGVFDFLRALVEEKKGDPELSYSMMASRMNERFKLLIAEKNFNGFSGSMVQAKAKNSKLVTADTSPRRVSRVYVPRVAGVHSTNALAVSRRRDVRDMTDVDFLTEMLKAHGFDEIPGVLKLTLTELMKYELEEGIICCQYPVSESILMSNSEQLYCGVEIAKEGREKSLKGRYCPAHRVRALRGLNHSGKKIIPAENIISLERYLAEWKAKAIVIAKEWGAFGNALMTLDSALLLPKDNKSETKRKAALT
jgi:hypothetical protein